MPGQKQELTESLHWWGSVCAKTEVVRGLGCPGRGKLILTQAPSLKDGYVIKSHLFTLFKGSGIGAEEMEDGDRFLLFYTRLGVFFKNHPSFSWTNV